MYGILEKQFRNLFFKASNLKGNTSENLIQLLERRLDAAVYRMKFVTTVFAARQFVSHGHVLVNGKKAWQDQNQSQQLWGRVLRPENIR